MIAKKAQKKRVSAPPDRIEFRADIDNPGLSARFHKILEAYAGDKAAIMRGLLVGYCDAVERDDRLPKLPLRVESKAAKGGK